MTTPIALSGEAHAQTVNPATEHAMITFQAFPDSWSR